MSMVFEETRVSQQKVNGMGDLGAVIKSYCEENGMTTPEKVSKVLGTIGCDMSADKVEAFYKGDYELTLTEFGAFHRMLNLDGSELFAKVGRLHGLSV